MSTSNRRAPTKTTTTARSKPFLLTVTPVKYSLTDGTNIPPPLESPVKERPTPGRAPWSSRPAYPERTMPGAYPSSEVDEDEFTVVPLTTRPTTPPTAPKALDVDSPMSTAVTASPPTPALKRRPSGVRRILSLSNLRSSFSSSRASLALPRESMDRPSSSRYDRSFALDIPSAAIDGAQESPPRRRGSRWFKRKSSMSSLKANGDPTSSTALGLMGTKRLKSSYSAPLLPDISELGGGDLDGGDLGWDAGAFKKS